MPRFPLRVVRVAWRTWVAFGSLLLALQSPPGLAADPSAAEQRGRNRITSPVDEEDRVTLTGNRHPRLARAQSLGRADDSLRMERMILSLLPDPGQEAELETHLASVRNPAAPEYGKWLGVREFESRFGVSSGDIEAVTRWLAHHGFTIDEIPAGRRSIVFSGTVAQLRSAFRTEMHHVRIGNARHLANMSDPQIPDALSSVVGGIVSLHDFRSRPLHTNVRVAPEFTNGSSHALAPADFQTIYNLKSVAAQAVDGTGSSIAVLGRTNVVTGDMQQFRSTMNLPANPPQVIINGADPGRVSGDEGESDLDLQWAGAVAPGATIKFVTSASTATTDGIDLSAQYAVSNNVADIITLSYGLCEADLGTTALNFYNGLWQQAAAQGMSVFVSSGDSGAAGCDSANATTATRGRAVNGLCSSQYSTCVGGTQFDDTSNPSGYWSATSNATDLGSALSYIPEVVWNESGSVSGGAGLWASGGGASAVYAKPSWQNAPGVPNDGKRDVPDVALAAASHDGYLVYSSDNSTSTRTRYVFGGTSAAAPSFAGIIALVRQKAGYRLGNVNPRLYQLAASQSAGGPAYFHRITSGNNGVPGVTGYSASNLTPAYNLASGLGSVDGDVLVNHWTDVLPATTTSLSTSAPTVPVGQNVILTASVTGSAPTGTVQFMDGSVALTGAVALSGGTASFTTSSLGVGDHVLYAIYSGDPANHASVSAGATVTVTQVPSSVVLAGPSQAVAQGQTVTLSATISGYSSGGTVKFMDGTTLLGTASVVNCVALLTATQLAPGTHTISAVYSGDANTLGSVSTALTITVTAVPVATTTIVAVSVANIAVGDTVVLSASVTGQQPGGSVQFKDGAANLGAPVPLNGAGASLSTTFAGIGQHDISAVYLGDASNNPSTSTAITLNVTRAASIIGLASSGATSVFGQSITFTATVNGYAPTGTVQFFDGGASLGIVSIASGTASLTISTLAVGAHSITAAYSGDTANLAAVSAPLAQVVVAPAAGGAGEGDVPVLPLWAMVFLPFVMARALWRSVAR